MVLYIYICIYNNVYIYIGSSPFPVIVTTGFCKVKFMLNDTRTEFFGEDDTELRDDAVGYTPQKNKVYESESFLKVVNIQKNTPFNKHISNMNAQLKQII